MHESALTYRVEPGACGGAVAVPVALAPLPIGGDRLAGIAVLRTESVRYLNREEPDEYPLPPPRLGERLADVRSDAGHSPPEVPPVIGVKVVCRGLPPRRTARLVSFIEAVNRGSGEPGIHRQSTHTVSMSI